MNVENEQILPAANYNTEIGGDYVKFIKIGNGFDATFPVSDFSQIAIYISEDEVGGLPIGTTDLSDLEANGYSGEDPIQDASLEIQEGNVEVFNDNPSDPNQQYDLNSYTVCVKILDGTMTAYTKRKT